MSRIPPNLRINADDFGLSAALSRAIAQAARDGLVNSISVVPFHDDESLRLLEALAARPDVRVGAHLTFIEVPLLTRPARYPDGRPPATYRQFLTAYLGGKVSARDVAVEWAAQLDLLGSRLGRKPIDHLDGHQHLHLLPALWRVARGLQRDYHVPVLRCPRERSLRAWLKDFPMGAGLQALALSRPGPVEERFFGVGTSMGFRAAAYAAEADLVRSHPERAYELMVHPGEDARGQRELEELARWLERLQG